MVAASASRLRWLAVPAVAIVFLLGVWVAGGLITNSFKGSMALTAAWVVLFGLVCLAIAIRVRALRVPVIGAFLATAALAGGYLAWTTLRDTVVHEQLAIGAPASSHPGPRANVELRAGTFESLEHSSHGRAAVVQTRKGKRFLTLTDFSTSPGPDLRVRIVPGQAGNGGADGARDLGALKGNKGNQQYELPAGLDLGRYTSVVIWCRAFSAGFARATLAPA
jgi:hypothetical protein